MKGVHKGSAESIKVRERKTQEHNYAAFNVQGKTLQLYILVILNIYIWIVMQTSKCIQCSYYESRRQNVYSVLTMKFTIHIDSDADVKMYTVFLL